MVSYLMCTGEKLFCNDSLARNKLRMSLCLRLNVRGPFSVPAGLSIILSSAAVSIGLFVPHNRSARPRHIFRI